MKKKYSSPYKKMAGTLLSCGFALAAAAQTQPLQAVTAKIADYRDHHLQEKIFAHTDKSSYFAGEYIWFKLYYVEGFTNHPITLSKVAYVELLDVNNQPVLQTKVSLNPGEENGSLSLPLNMPTGAYKLRAYTNWMKNFSPSFFFEKQITVINPLTNAKEQQQALPAEEVEVSLFPEGGNLVTSLPSTLAFKINDAYGRGLDGKGWIVDEKNDTLTAFTSRHLGMGKISVTPAQGHSYKAIVMLPDGRKVVKDLPSPLPVGYVMHLEKNDNGSLQIYVQTNNQSQGTIYLIGHCRGVATIAQQAPLSGGSATFTINADQLPPGISQFTVFSNASQPLAERLYFKSPPVANTTALSSDHNDYGPRQKVDLSFQAGTSQKSTANLSLAVYRIDSVQTPDQMNIQNYLLLSSDIAGWIESPQYYFSNTREAAEAADNLMLTQGWRRFSWQDMLQSAATEKPVFPPEINGNLVTAHVTDIRTGASVQGLQTYLSLPGIKYQVYFAQSDSKGNVQFELKRAYGSGTVVVHPFAADDSLYKVELQNPFLEQYTSWKPAPPNPSPSQEQLLENYTIGMQVREVFAGDSLSRTFAPSPKDTFSFLGKAEYQYNLDDYTRFTTMEEVLREYVRPINVGVRKGKPHILFYNETYRSNYDDNILVMLDGVPLNQPDRLFSYDPLKIKSLDVFPKAFVLGSAYFLGVANFQTYKGVFDGYELDPHLIAMDFEGLQMQREFYAPSYNTPDKLSSRIPDYRNTLYWDPNVSTENGKGRLSFYTCDQKGRYLCLLQGIDSDGHPTSTQYTFEVK